MVKAGYKDCNRPEMLGKPHATDWRCKPPKRRREKKWREKCSHQTGCIWPGSELEVGDSRYTAGGLPRACEEVEMAIPSLQQSVADCLYPESFLKRVTCWEHGYYDGLNEFNCSSCNYKHILLWNDKLFMLPLWIIWDSEIAASYLNFRDDISHWPRGAMTSFTSSSFPKTAILVYVFCASRLIFIAGFGSSDPVRFLVYLLHQAKPLSP